MYYILLVSTRHEGLNSCRTKKMAFFNPGITFHFIKKYIKLICSFGLGDIFEDNTFSLAQMAPWNVLNKNPERTFKVGKLRNSCSVVGLKKKPIEY